MDSKYPRQSLGHVLDELRSLGITETIAGSVTVGDGKIYYTDEVFARYKYFDGIEQPLFRFSNSVYGQHRHIVNEQNELKSNFHLSLSNRDTPGLIVTGFDATQSLREYISKVMFTSIDCWLAYKLRADSEAIFQIGSDTPAPGHDPFMGYIFIEFQRPEGAQAFVDFINENFVRKL